MTVDQNYGTLSDMDLLKSMIEELTSRTVMPVEPRAFVGIVHPYHTDIIWLFNRWLAIKIWVSMLNTPMSARRWWGFRPWK